MKRLVRVVVGVVAAAVLGTGCAGAGLRTRGVATPRAPRSAEMAEVPAGTEAAPSGDVVIPEGPSAPSPDPVSD